MSLTPAQLATLKAAILAETDAAFVSARTNGQTPLMASFYNEPSAFVVRRSRVMSSEIGPALNYVAVSNLTTLNRDRATTFVVLNPDFFAPTADVEAYFETTFGGTLGGEGANTRAALQALWRRFAKRGERLYATGTGTTPSPGALVYEGDITDADIGAALELA
jgi:hypothetical protein